MRRASSSERSKLQSELDLPSRQSETRPLCPSGHHFVVSAALRSSEVAEANISALIAGLYLKLGMADEALKEGECPLSAVACEYIICVRI